MVTFSDLKLNENTLRALDRRGFHEPTPIQELAIPLLLQGEDLIAQARTGTGKTAAFGLPIIEATRGHELQTLVLAPTRELANQIVDELNKLNAGTTFLAFPVYGGVGFGRQIDAIRRKGKGAVTCLVACPGRLLDLMQQGVLRLDTIRNVVLDEADRMLDMGFVRDIDRIFAKLPRDRHTMLFSATMPPEIRKLGEKYLRHPEFVRAESEEEVVATRLTEQYGLMVRGDKLPTLLGVMDQEKPGKSLIFTRTKHGAKRLAKQLAAAGWKADALQGNLSQNARDRVMAAFRTGEIPHLVATDVAARGIDVKDVALVVNYDLPTVAEDYVHRIGRTGRMGREGRAVAFVAPDEMNDVRAIERASGVPLKEYALTRTVAPPAAASAMKDNGPPRGGYRNGGGHSRPAPRPQGSGQHRHAPARSHGGHSQGRPQGRPSGGQRGGQRGGEPRGSHGYGRGSYPGGR